MHLSAMLCMGESRLYPSPESLWAFAAVIPLVPIGTALLFPSTTSLMSRQSDPRELGTTMGVAQTFAGLARVAAPLLATMAFQRLGHGAPFYLGGACVAVAGVLAFQIQVGPGVSAHPARSETSSGSPQAAASFTTRPQGSIKLGWTNAEACAYHRTSSRA